MESKRALLEVFKLLQPRDVLTACELVSSLWGKAAAHEELWHCFDEDLGLGYTSTADPKAAYRTAAHCQHYLIYLKSNVLYYYSCLRETFIGSLSLSSPVEVSTSTAIVLLREGSVLLCGGTDYTIEDRTERIMDSCTRIEANGTVQPLHSMLSRRASPAAIEVNSTLYLFCGFLLTTLSTCEKLCLLPINTLATRLWQPLPNTLSPRQACNPCALHSYIYLCGRWNSEQTYERFDTVTETFTVIDVGQAVGRGVRSSVIYKGQVVVVEATKLVQFTPETRQTTTQSLPGVFAQSAMNPVLKGDRLYSLDQSSGCVYCLSLGALRSVAVGQLPAICRFRHYAQG